MLEFENQKEAEQTLLLFWRVAMRLSVATDQLPAVDTRFHMRLEKGKVLGSLSETLESSARSILKIGFQTLPEEQFEVLALRFRPFFAQSEDVHFLKILSLLDRKNPQVRLQTKELRESWRHAVFWGKMALSFEELRVKADAVISIGFYSKYFHVEAEKLALADEYRSKMGSEMFDVALQSAVWHRACLVVALARGLQQPLFSLGALTQEEIDAKPLKLPPILEFQLEGGPGALEIREPGELTLDS